MPFKFKISSLKSLIVNGVNKVGKYAWSGDVFEGNANGHV